jgi:hypothetical protein
MSNMHSRRCSVCSGIGRVLSTPSGCNPLTSPRRICVCRNCSGKGYIVEYVNVRNLDLLENQATEETIREVLFLPILDLQPLSCR